MGYGHSVYMIISKHITCNLLNQCKNWFTSNNDGSTRNSGNNQIKKKKRINKQKNCRIEQTWIKAKKRILFWLAAVLRFHKLNSIENVLTVRLLLLPLPPPQSSFSFLPSSMLFFFSLYLSVCFELCNFLDWFEALYKIHTKNLAVLFLSIFCFSALLRHF